MVLINEHNLLKRYIHNIQFGQLGGQKPDITIEDIDHHVVKLHLSFDLEEELAQDDWQINIFPSFVPNFHWAPHLTPTDDHIIDQHSFRSPSLVVNDQEKLVMVIPDLDIMSNGTPARWYLDLNASENKLTLGMSHYKVTEHVLFERCSGAVYPKGKIEFGFYIMMYDDPDIIFNPWRPVLHFLWEKWGRKLYEQGLPLTGSLNPYVEHTYKWAFKEWEKSVWQEFELNGKKIGAPVFIVNVTQSPNYPGPVNEREFRSIWNQAWFSSLRSASGLYRYARDTNNDELLKKALLTKELALSAPKMKGFFPSVIATEMEEIEVDGKKVHRSKGWETYYWGNSNRNPFTHDAKVSPFHVLDMSWTALLMLRWYEELEQDERLLFFAIDYADSLLTIQDKKGYFPAWLDKETLEPLGILDDSPETSLSITFLLKLYTITDDKRYKRAALQAMEVICNDVIMTGRWEDFETYWSCSTYGNSSLVGEKVARNNMYKQCNFSIFWTAEALFECYKITNNVTFLNYGERCMDELLMTQASWEPPYLYTNTLGGFGVMNADGEWNDSRQCLFAELIVMYGKELGRNEYIQRGLAALRSSFTMMYCPENEKTKRQWEKKWPFFNERDYGFMMENYGHGGKVNPDGLGIGEFTIYDWGNGAAAESYLRMKDHFGNRFVEGQ
ncbi:hypothetical protein [Neobacillus jeddahensis]|uniref:hypothetical protein n=1 Tax=Neobacillus jeddahensis TaxID=1461580 RepID=UPI0006936A6C|nr:hypothetical protein [Neobacillus jeddahensis]